MPNIQPSKIVTEQITYKEARRMGMAVQPLGVRAGHPLTNRVRTDASRDALITVEGPALLYGFFWDHDTEVVTVYVATNEELEQDRERQAAGAASRAATDRIAVKLNAELQAHRQREALKPLAQRAAFKRSVKPQTRAERRRAMRDAK